MKEIIKRNKPHRIFDKKLKRDQWHVRFRLNNLQYRLKADTRDELQKIIDNVRAQENRDKINDKHGTNLYVVRICPTLDELFEKALKKITNDKHKQLSARVFKTFLSLLPPNIKVNELTRHHFQEYINHRQSQLGKQTGKPLKPQTINKELFAISGILTKAATFFPELEDWTRPRIDWLKETDSERELNITLDQFDLLLKTLRKERVGKQTVYTENHRHRLADELEFRRETALRRKEVLNLEFKQYIESEKRLVNVKRFKTNTIKKSLPLTKRAAEIIEARREQNSGSRYIFTTDGSPSESDYRTLKKVCGGLNIPYGRYTEDGFVPHDLRHLLATEIARVSDIETSRKYLGHAKSVQTLRYLHSEDEMEARVIEKLDEIRYGKDNREGKLIDIYHEIKSGKITEQQFIEEINKLSKVQERVVKMWSR